MRLLVMGGTQFIGRHTVSRALDAGHEVTLVHRNPSPLFPESEHVFLDRTAGPDALAPLAGREFDGLIDVSAYVPRSVRQLGEVLGDRVERALYVSSVSIYAPGGGVADTTGRRGDGAGEEVTDESYGPLKMACEEEFTHWRNDSAATTIVRPTYVIGPYDHTERFAHWVRRTTAGGEVLVTDPIDGLLQVIDARDLADFMVGQVEHGGSGTFDGVGPEAPLTLEAMIQTCARAAGTSVELVPASRDWLTSQGLDIDSDLPLLDPPEEMSDFHRDPTPALAAGLRLRPLEDSARDILAWDHDRGLPPLPSLSLEREAELIAALRA